MYDEQNSSCETTTYSRTIEFNENLRRNRSGMNLSFYTPISYDYKYSLPTILSYYKIADEILLAIDKDRISWSKNKFAFDECFFDEIKKIDVENKISIVEGDFHSLDSPIQNDTNERNFITTVCKKDNFIVGIDSDEVLLNPNEFLEWLNVSNPHFSDVSCMMSSVYKAFGKTLLVNYPKESVVIGTKSTNCYKICRNTKNASLMSPLKILHFSWGRTRQDILQKLSNFGHSKDFNIDDYMKIWDNVTLENYALKKELHPLLKCRKHIWLSLEAVNLDDFKLEEPVAIVVLKTLKSIEM